MLDNLFIDGKPTALQAGDIIGIATEKGCNRPETFTVFRKPKNRFLLDSRGLGKFTTPHVVQNEGDFTGIMLLISYLLNLKFRLTTEETEFSKKNFFEFY
jgi:hypothetical protein